ncbi:MAG: colicin E5-related ribonuclease [Steroidobacter sp.]
MSARGWTTKSINDAINRPLRTVATRDTRYLSDGSRMNAPATAFYGRSGGYVVRNDATGDIVQVSDRYDQNWRAPWD